MTQTANSIESRKSGKPGKPKVPSDVEPNRYPKRKMHPNSLKNLVAPWKSGDIPNPTGKNGRDVAREIAQAVITGNREAIYVAMTRAILKGNAYAFTQVAERGYGKMVQKTEVTGKDGGALEVRDVGDADLIERITALERDLGLASAIDDAGRVGSAAAGKAKARNQTKTADVLSR